MKKHTTHSTARNPAAQAKKRYAAALTMIDPDAAFVDVGSAEHRVCIPADRCEKPVRRFEAFTADLYALRDWLKEHGIKTAGMESTGVYWINLYQILEDAGMRMHLVNARDVKSVRGRPKTDNLDCQWGQRLLSYGLLRDSFRPPPADLRSALHLAHAKSPPRDESAAAQSHLRHYRQDRDGHHQSDSRRPERPPGVGRTARLSHSQK